MRNLVVNDSGIDFTVKSTSDFFILNPFVSFLPEGQSIFSYMFRDYRMYRVQVLLRSVNYVDLSYYTKYLVFLNFSTPPFSLV